MKRRLMAVVLSASLAAGALAGCSDNSEKKTAPVQALVAGASKESEGRTGSQGTADVSMDPSVDLIFTLVSVTDDSHTITMMAFAGKVKELSEGFVICKTYSDGTLFSSENEFDALLSGGTDLTYIPFSTLATQSGLEWCSMVASGYLWSFYDHMTNTLDREPEGGVSGGVRSQVSCIPTSASYLGNRVVNTRNKEISTYEDISGILLRMPNPETWLSLGEALGADPTPLLFSELYAALQTDAVDAQENPLPTDINAAFYEVALYITITNYVIDSILPCIDTDTRNSMTDVQEVVVTEAMEYVRSANDDARIGEEEKNIAFLEERDCTITYPGLMEFKEKVQAHYTNHPKRTETWDVDLYSGVQIMAN